ncbi:Uncharacterised protein [Serratia fonticola]|uniref:glycosyltransferase n=1 Tax=Serratia fonticola TaxID=47917 RepID=UPI002183756D|nr:glycosyltransferase [Serratia fonticola]CAI2136879.1 Uncharacterised protein [Serratia fonticola]
MKKEESSDSGQSSLVTVNVTTTNSRLDLCSQTIWSLIHQSILPSKIVVWVSEDAYLADKGISAIPAWCQEINLISGNLVEFKWVKNTGPYRKILPALRSARPDDILVYADDDTVYGRLWLSKLLSSFMSDEHKIVAARVRKLQRNTFGMLKSYIYSTVISKNSVVLDDYVITGVGGVMLMRKHILDEYINMDDYLKVCPTTDDLWISKLIQLSSTAVLVCPDAMLEVFEIQHSQGLTLINNVNSSKKTRYHSLINKIKNRVAGMLGYSLCNNDKAIKSIDAFFKR